MLVFLPLLVKTLVVLHLAPLSNSLRSSTSGMVCFRLIFNSPKTTLQPSQYLYFIMTIIIIKTLGPNLSPHRPQYEGPIFTTDPNSQPAYYPYAFDIQVALLRATYYLAKYTLHQPFIYKALHFPEQITQEDAETVAECLCVCILLSFTWRFPLLHVLTKTNTKGT